MGTGRSARSFALAALLLAGLSPSSPAVAGDATVEAELRRAHGELVPGLLRIAEWCDTKKLYLARDEIAQSILELEPDHAQARRWLKFVRRGDEWHRPRPYVPPRDWDPPALAEMPALRAAVFGRFADEMLELLAANDGTTSPGVRCRVVRTVLAVAPEDARFRMLNREVQHGGRWVLEETRRTRAGRERIVAAARSALEKAGTPRQDDLTTREAHVGLGWRAFVATENVRVVAATSLSEAERVATLCEAVPHLLGAALELEVTRPGTITMYLLESKSQARLVALAEPTLGEQGLSELDGFSSIWVPRRLACLVYSRRGSHRVDSAVRLSMDRYLGRATGIRSLGWVDEGTGIYLSSLLSGTKLTWLIQEAHYAHESGEGRGLADADDWMADARALARSTPPDLDLLLRRTLNAMTAEDVVFAYAFTAYLLEAWPEQGSNFYCWLGEGVSLPDAVQRSFDTDLDGLTYRFLRWLRETE